MTSKEFHLMNESSRLEAELCFPELELGAGYLLLYALRQVAVAEDVVGVKVILDGLDDAEAGTRHRALQPLLANLAHYKQPQTKSNPAL